MNDREATQAKLQELLSRAPPLPGREIYQKYIMMNNNDESSTQRLTDQFKILKPPPKANKVSTEMIYARKSRYSSPNLLLLLKRSTNNQENEMEVIENVENDINTRPASTSKVNGLSWHLQLDQDKYVDRRRFFDSAEKLSKDKQEAYEMYLHQRLQRASQGSHRAFLDLAKRNEEWQKQCNDRRKHLKEQAEEEWINRRKEFREKLSEHIHKTLQPDHHHHHCKENEIDATDRQREWEDLRRRSSQSPFSSRPVSFQSRPSSSRARSRGRGMFIFVYSFIEFHYFD